MRKGKKVIIIAAAVLCAAAVIVLCTGEKRKKPSEARAVERVQAFAEAVNYEYKTPEKAYVYLTQTLKEQISEEDFVTAFLKERSYPYLTPFFINYESIEMADDLKSGVAHFSQAARLPGMVYDLPFVYENGDYYVTAFEELADGSYLEKFDKLD